MPVRQRCEAPLESLRTNLDWMRMMRLAKFSGVPKVNSNGSIRRRTCLRSMWCLETQTAGSESRRSTTGTFEQCGTASHRIQLLDTARHCSLERGGRPVCYRTCGSGRIAVQLFVEAGMEPKLEVVTDSSANLGMHNRIGSERVRHLDMKWLWTQEAVQSGRFSLKKVSTDRNVSDLTRKHHHEDRLVVLMSLGRLRFARGRGDAVLAANEGRTAAVNAVRRTRRARSTELDENVLRLWGDISSLADPGGRERQRALRDGRLAERSQDQHTSDAPVGRGSVDSAQEAEVPRVAV